MRLLPRNEELPVPFIPISIDAQSSADANLKTAAETEQQQKDGKSVK